jgi:glutamine cyclotransferase
MLTLLVLIVPLFVACGGDDDDGDLTATTTTGAPTETTASETDDASPTTADNDTTPTTDATDATPTTSAAEPTATTRAQPTGTPSAVTPTTAASPAATVVPLPLEGQINGTIDISPTQWRNIAAGAGSLWVTDTLTGILERVDPASGEIVERISVGMPMQTDGQVNTFGVAYGAESVWVAAQQEQLVKRIDPATNEVVSTISVDGHVLNLVATDDAIWASATTEDKVLRIDPATNEVVAVVDLSGPPVSLRVHAGLIWTDTQRGQLFSIDPGTNIATQRADFNVDVVCPCSSHWTVSTSGVWVNADRGAVKRFDPTNGQLIAQVEANSGSPVEVVASGDIVWIVVDDGDGQGHLERIDPLTNQVVAQSPSFLLEPDQIEDETYSYAVFDNGVVWMVASDSTLVGIAADE